MNRQLHVKGYGYSWTGANRKTFTGAIFVVMCLSLVQGSCLKYLIDFWLPYVFGTQSNAPLGACMVATIAMGWWPLWLASVTFAIAGGLP